MLLGIWKNVAELEETLSLPEMELVVKAAHEREHRHNRFAAALKGIDIDEGEQDDVRERMEAVEARAAARLRGEDPDEAEFATLGIVRVVAD